MPYLQTNNTFKHIKSTLTRKKLGMHAVKQQKNYNINQTVRNGLL